MRKLGHKRNAMTLLSIMFAMIVVMVAIVVAMPIFTKKIAKESESEGTHGYYICYCGDNTGKAVQTCNNNFISVYYSGSGEPVVTKNQPNCTFTPPEDATAITVTLVGGGGGGIGSAAVELTDEELEKDTVLIGTNGFDLSPFKNYKGKYKTDRDSSSYDRFLKTLYENFMKVPLLSENTKTPEQKPEKKK